MKYYKATLKNGPLMVDVLPPECRIHYKPGEWVEAPGDTMLFICQSAEDAKIQGGYPSEIWEVEAQGVRDLYGGLWPLAFKDFEDLEGWWRTESIQRKTRSEPLSITIPPTPVAKRVKLVRRVG